MSCKDGDDFDEVTPVRAVDAVRSLAEANLELCRNENERLCLEMAAMRAELAEKDRLIAKLKMELRRLLIPGGKG